MQFRSQLTSINKSSLIIHPKSLPAFQVTSGSTYTIQPEKLKPFKPNSTSIYFEMPLVFSDDNEYFVIANWLYLQHQFQNLATANSKIPIVLLSKIPCQIESISWHYALQCIARSHNRHTLISELRIAMLESPIQHLKTFFSEIDNKPKKSTLEKICIGETRQTISTQLKNLG